MGYRTEIVQTRHGYKVERLVWYNAVRKPTPPRFKFNEEFDVELERRMNDGTLTPDTEFNE